MVVNNPPDLADTTQRSNFDKMVAAFEDTEFTMRRNATMFWLYAFDAQLKEDLTEKNISLPEKLNNGRFFVNLIAHFSAVPNGTAGVRIGCWWLEGAVSGSWTWTGPSRKDPKQCHD